ncbi:hypothetical protein CANCADRAFT_32663 [Tortispora caseinolytica NRRL Y-17796]|uniref:Histone transcription regulator 3 homolog n=1 Tax=Tortispora caseinolytica NRRL Y-17796 TaxID=767744 RepID=A0A1E4TC99_9ASCO|nr:hypothetical protein CANCADRAFT_32663 [Tortispora caseinolytica NRRL Y-17796]
MDKTVISDFKAINVVDDAYDIDDDTQTQELQAEEALKIFRSALNLQEQGDLQAALLEYQKVFAIRSLFDEPASFSSPLVRKLRYMVYKNHALLQLSLLKSPDDVPDQIESLLSDLVNALEADSEDFSLWSYVSVIAYQMSSFRLARFALESIPAVDSGPLSLQLSLQRKSPILPQLRVAMHRLVSVLHQISDLNALDAKFYQTILSIPALPDGVLDRYHFIAQHFAKPAIYNSASPPPPPFVIHIDNNSWLAVAYALLFPCVDSSVHLDKKLTMKLPLVHPEESVHTSFALILPFSKETMESCRYLRIYSPESDPNEPLSGDETEISPSEDLPDAQPPNNDLSNDEDDSNVQPLNNEHESTDSDSDRKRKSSDPLSANSADDSSGRVSKRLRSHAPESDSTAERAAAFFSSFNSRILSHFYLHLPEPPSILPRSADDYQQPPLGDLHKILLSWSVKHSDAMLKLQNSTATAKDNSEVNAIIMDLMTLNNSAADSKPDISKSPVTPLSLFERYNATHMSLDYMRVQFLIDLLSSSNPRLFLDFKWPPELMTVVRMYIDLFERNLQDYARSVDDRTADSEHAFQVLRLCQALADIFLDDLIQFQQSLRTAISEKAHNLNRMRKQEVVKSSRVQRWLNMFQSVLSLPCLDESLHEFVELKVRYFWTFTLFCQAIGSSKEDLIQRFDDLKALVKDQSFSSELSVINTPHIPKISLESADGLVSRVKTLSMFTELLSDDGNMPVDERITSLEHILKPSSNKDNISELDSGSESDRQPVGLQDFLQTMSPFFHLHLWNLLSSSYASEGRTVEELGCHISTVDMFMQRLFDDKYAAMAQDEREILLLRSMAALHTCLTTMVRLVTKDRKLLREISVSVIQEFAENIILLLSIVQVFVLFDDAIALNTIAMPSLLSYKSAALRFKEIYDMSWLMLYLSLQQLSIRVKQVASEQFETFLAELHEYLGLRGYCGLLKGVLLTVIQEDLAESTSWMAESELIQCLRCRFGISISTEHFIPFEHQVIHTKFDRNSAVMLLPFIVRLAQNNKTSQGLPRADLKGALDSFSEVIEIPDKTDAKIAYNLKAVESYLEEPIHPFEGSKCLRGDLYLSMAQITNSSVDAARLGFYYLEGIIFLGLHRAKKKSLNGRTDDLGHAVKYLTYDLLCNSSRFESWYSLAQVYDGIVESDMTYSPEKLIPEKSKDIISNRRKSLKCYLMAVSLVFRNNIKDAKLNSFWYDCAFAFYSATREPLAMLTFKVPPKTVGKPANGELTQCDRPSMKEDAVLRFAHILVAFGLRCNSKNWKLLVLEGKIIRKLYPDDPRRYLAIFARAAKVAPERHSNGDTLVEPHYYLVSYVYKCSKELSLAECLDYLASSQYCDFFKGTEAWNVRARNELLDLLISVLKKIRSADKKKWQHRPTFRIVDILANDLNDYAEAYKELSPLINLKAGSSSKSLFNVWKPDSERAGRHFICSSQYLCFMNYLFMKLGDIDNLIQLAKGVRKNTSSIWMHQKVWSYIMDCAVALVIEQCDLDLDVLNNTRLAYESFTARGAILEILFAKVHCSELVRYLVALAELRKLNSGLASTQYCETVFVSLYVKIDIEFPSIMEKARELLSQEEIEEAILKGESMVHIPSNRSRGSRVARKDIITKANALVRVISENAVPKKRVGYPTATRLKNQSISESALATPEPETPATTAEAEESLQASPAAFSEVVEEQVKSRDESTEPQGKSSEPQDEYTEPRNASIDPQDKSTEPQDESTKT